MTARLKSQEVLKHVLRHVISRNSCFASSHGVVLGKPDAEVLRHGYLICEERAKRSSMNVDLDI